MTLRRAEMIRVFGTALAFFIVFLALAAMAHAETCGASYYDARGGGMTTAHRTLPFGTRLLVSHANHSAILRVSDRGPFIAGRCLDVSRQAARVLGLISVGVAHVQFERVR